MFNLETVLSAQPGLEYDRSDSQKGSSDIHTRTDTRTYAP